MKTITFSAPHIKRYETDEFQQGPEPTFIAVSLKGDKCFLQCDHCRTKMLSALYKADEPEKLRRLCENVAARGCKGMLVTGGCDPDGTIPIYPFVETIAQAKKDFGFKLAAHTKLANEDFIKAVKEADIDILMVDLVGDLEAMRSVYHLKNYDLGHIERSLELAAKYEVALAPHIMLGISNGKINGEYKALEMLKDKPFDTLVLVVLTPLRNTPMADCKIDQAGVLEFLEQARKAFPTQRLTLGCAKTWGKMQRAFEEKALEMGYNAIAYPSEGIVEKSIEMGFKPRFTEACCAFPWPFCEK